MHNHEPENYVCPLCQIAKGEKTDMGSQEESVIFRNDFITAFVAPFIGVFWPFDIKANNPHSNQHRRLELQIEGRIFL